MHLVVCFHQTLLQVMSQASILARTDCSKLTPPLSVEDRQTRRAEILVDFHQNGKRGRFAGGFLNLVRNGYGLARRLDCLFELPLLTLQSSENSQCARFRLPVFSFAKKSECLLELRRVLTSIHEKPTLFSGIFKAACNR